MTSLRPIDLPHPPSFRLDGRRALVTGGGRGLGLAAAAALADAGAHVILAARSSSEIEAAAAAVRSRGGRADTLIIDICDIAAVASAFDRIAPLDILVNNAGTNRPMPIGEVTAADFDTIFGLNVRATYFLCQAMIGHLVSGARGGTIINMSSQMGHVGARDRSVYCASKHAVEGMTKALAVECGEHGIRVNSIAPTFIETPMTAPFLNDAAFKASTLAKIKLGRLGTVQDIMGALVFLSSDAASMITGASLLVDGGWTAE